MKVETSADTKEIKYFMPHFIKMTGGIKRLRKRIEEIEKKRNQIIGGDVDRFKIEIGLGLLLKHKRNRGEYPEEIKTNEEYKAVSFAAMIVRVHKKLNPRHQRELEGKLRGYLNEDTGYAPLAFEMFVLQNLMVRDFDVSLVDLEGIENFDFLASKDGIDIEIECKHISADIGRKIPTAHFETFCNKIKTILDEYKDDNSLGTIIKIIIPDRLEKSDHQLNSLKERLEQFLKSSRSSVDFDGYRIEKISFDLK